MDAVTDTGANVLRNCIPAFRRDIVKDWLSRIPKPNGFLLALIKSYNLISDDQNVEICQKVLELWKQTNSIDTRVSILKALTTRVLLPTEGKIGNLSEIVNIEPYCHHQIFKAICDMLILWSKRCLLFNSIRCHNAVPPHGKF